MSDLGISESKLEGTMKRYALISAKRDTAEVIARYLPQNYKVLGTVMLDDYDFGDYKPGVVIGGEDRAGWTLDGYVLPRLGSGLIWGKEIDLSHAAMKQIPLDVTVGKTEPGIDVDYFGEKRETR